MINVSKPSLGPEEAKAVKEVIESGWLGQGPKVEAFEQACRKLIGCRHFLSLSSGTKALEIALLAAGARAGDEVLVPSLTYAATIQAILSMSLVPVFVDINQSDANICLEDASHKIGPKSKFLMPVHLRGRSVDMKGLSKLSKDFGLSIVEDAAHAFASAYDGKSVGQESTMACFSFGPIKNITCGSGGGLATNDDSIAEFIRSYRNMGVNRSTWERYSPQAKTFLKPWEYRVNHAGGRCHLSEMNAAIGLEQLKKIPKFKRIKKNLIHRYQEELKTVSDIEWLHSDPDEDFLYLCVALVPASKKESLMEYLLAKGIGAATHYPPNHHQPFFKTFSQGSLPATEDLCSRMLTLPSYMDLSENEQSYIISEIKRFFS